MNENTIWAEIIVDELLKCGLKYVCIGAGSRSTPLTLAFARNTGIEAISFVDERSAGYFALGLAMHSNTPVAIVCTSGTALANIHPSVLESYHSNIPLLVLSADRPHELRNSGANQTMDQIKFFGDNIKKFIDFAVPETVINPKMIRYIRTTIDNLFGITNQIPKGPVHLNFPYRKPLHPVNIFEYNSIISSIEEHGKKKFIEIISGKNRLDDNSLEYIEDKINNSINGLIIIGTSSTGIDFEDELIEFSKKSNYPILADPASGIRYYPNNSNIISSYDIFLKNPVSKSDIIFLFNKIPTSKFLTNYLGRHSGEIIMVNDSGYHDSTLKSSVHIIADPKYFLSDLNSKLTTRENDSWLHLWRKLDNDTINNVKKLMADEYFEGNILQFIFLELQSNSLIFTANSLTIRYLDQFIFSMDKKIKIFNNRGLSGIDGNISTAAGIAKSSNSKVILLIGDLSFYHDTNALLTIMKLELDMTIILFNNRGGGIFHRLPISKFDPHFTEFFVTPHEIEFQKISEGYGIKHTKVDDMNGFIYSFKNSLENNACSVIEVVIDINKSNKIINKLS